MLKLLENIVSPSHISRRRLTFDRLADFDTIVGNIGIDRLADFDTIVGNLGINMLAATNDEFISVRDAPPTESCPW